MCEEGALSKTAAYSKLWLNKYNSIRGKKRSEFPFPFWDVVAITTADAAQKEAYMLQLKKKISLKELPEDVDFHVIADLPGPKLGNGGSTFIALSALESVYGEKLFSMKVLLLHAGGQSQRMPSASLLGKVFTALPFGEPMYQMLDVKLAYTIPFLENMEPGVLLVCADDVEIYNVAGEEDSVRMDKPGFTVLAHPGNLEMGTGHGVYVIEGGQLHADKLVQTSECLEVLQKPSLERMVKSGAHLTIIKSSLNGSSNNNNRSSADSEISAPTVYTDSMFYFDAGISRKLLKFYHENEPLTCEIDAYGDFLQCLGSRATIDYVTLTNNVSELNPELVPMRKKVYHLLTGTPIHVLGLNESRFVHIGTTQEMLYHFCEDENLRNELGLTNSVFTHWVDGLMSGGGDEPVKEEPLVEGCVMHCKLPSTSSVGKRAVAEFCWFEMPLHLGKNCIISNCQLLREQSDLPCVDVPDDLFIHTAAIKGDNSTCFVTVLFDIFENLKKKAASADEIVKLPYLKKTVGEMCEMENIDPASVKPLNGSCWNLWNCRLFPVTNTMTESLVLTLKMIKCLGTKHPTGDNYIDLSSYTLVSMADILEQKNVKAMLSYRDQLHSAITEAINK